MAQVRIGPRRERAPLARAVWLGKRSPSFQYFSSRASPEGVRSQAARPAPFFKPREAPELRQYLPPGPPRK